MRLKHWLTLSLGVGLLWIGGMAAMQSSLDAQEKRLLADKDNPFVGKIVMVYERNDPSKAGVGFVLKNATFADIKGLRFIVGKCVDERKDALAGYQTSIPLDNIGSIVEFDNIEAYKQFAKKLSQMTAEEEKE